MGMHFIENGANCPQCGNLNDGATGHQRPPQPEDFTLCMYCGHLSRYTEDMKLRTPSDEEMERVFAAEPSLKMQLVAARLFALTMLESKQTKDN